MKLLTITKKLIGKAEDYPFEERLYHGMLMFMLGFALTFTIITIFHKLYIDLIFNCITLLIFGGLYYLALVKKRYFFFGFYLFLVLAIVFAYFSNKGIYGTTPITSLLILVLALGYNPAKRRGIILLIHSVVIVSLFAIEYRWPQLVHDPFKTPQTFFIIMAITILVCMFMIFLIINFLKNSYENERKLGNQQKK